MVQILRRLVRTEPTIISSRIGLKIVVVALDTPPSMVYRLNMKLYESMAGNDDTLSACLPNKSRSESFSLRKPRVARNSAGTFCWSASFQALIQNLDAHEAIQTPATLKSCRDFFSSVPTPPKTRHRNLPDHALSADTLSATVVSRPSCEIAACRHRLETRSGLPGANLESPPGVAPITEQ